MECFWIAKSVLASLVPRHTRASVGTRLRLCINPPTWHHWFSLSIYAGKVDVELFSLLNDDLVTFTQSVLQSQCYHLSCSVDDTMNVSYLIQCSDSSLYTLIIPLYSHSSQLRYDGLKPTVSCENDYTTQSHLRVFHWSTHPYTWLLKSVVLSLGRGTPLLATDPADARKNRQMGRLLGVTGPHVKKLDPS